MVKAIDSEVYIMFDCIDLLPSELKDFLLEYAGWAEH